VGALRDLAKRQGVDTSYKSSGGANPLAAGEKPRPVTSGDIQQMFQKQAEIA
jgi:hypothetical protein